MTPEQRRALALAKARKRKAEAEAEAQATPNPELDTYRLPKRMFGVNMPFADEPTEVVSNTAEGYQVLVPKNAPDHAQAGVVAGVQQGREDREKYANLSLRGATTLASNFGGIPTAGFVGDIANRSSGGRNKTVERVAAASYGAQDFPTLGFSDEITGLIHGQDAFEQQRQGVKDAYAEHPLSTFAGGAPSLIMPAGSIQGTTGTARLLSSAARFGIPSAVHGYGSGEGGPVSSDRLLRSSIQGGIGAVTGAGGERAGAIGSKLIRSLPGNHALRSVFSKIANGEEGLSRQELVLLEDAITQTQALARTDGRGLNRAAARQELMTAIQNSELNAFLGESFGTPGVRAMQGLAVDGGSEVIEKVSRRGAEQTQRIASVVTDLTGGNDIASGLKSFDNYRKNQANPLYAQSMKVPVNVNDPRFVQAESFKKLPFFNLGVRRGEELMRLATRNPNARFKDMPYYEQVQFIKEGLDDRIGVALRQGDDNLARQLTSAKNDWLSIIDDMNPTYGQARQMWSGQAAMRTAMLRGEQVLGISGGAKSGQALRDLQEAYEKMSEFEQISFQIGMFDQIMTSVRNTPATPTANSAKAKFLTPHTEDVIRGFMPDDQANAFLGMIEREARQQGNANQILPRSGPGTSSDLQAVEAVRRGTGGLRGLIGQLSDPQALIGRQQDRARAWLSSNQGRQNALGRFLSIQEGDDAFNALSRALRTDGPQQPPVSPLGPNRPQLPPPEGGGSAPPSGTQATMTDRAVDAGALGVAATGLAPSADAEGINYEAQFAAVDQELQAAQTERAATVERLQAAQDELAAWKQRFNAPDRDVRAIQTFLRDNVNPDLAIDGDPGGNTATANQGYTLRLEEAVVAQQEALARNDALVQQATGRRDDLEKAQALEAAEPNPLWEAVRDKLFYPAAGLGIYLGARGRGGRNRAAKQNALDVEGRVEGLLAPSKGVNALSKDANNLNEVWKLGGAGESVPFETTKTGVNAGQPRHKSNALAPAALFPKGQFFDGGDLKASAMFGVEGALAHIGKRAAESEVADAEDRLEAAKASGDMGDIRDAARNLEMWKTVYRLAEGAERFGLAGIATTGAYGVAKRYATPQPGIGKIGDRQGSVLKRIEDRKNVSKGADTH